MTVACQPGLAASAPSPTSDRSPTDRMVVMKHVDHMKPFLVSVVGNSDLWMYVSSSGGLTCGRQSAERCLFPYETDDRLHRNGGRVGPFTRLRIATPQGVVQWRPFSPEPDPATERSLAKSELGHQVVFEERHRGLGLTFRYRWANARKHGFVRTAELIRDAGDGAPMQVELLDGLLDIMPSGVELTTQQRASALVNAYRHTELDPLTNRLAIYRLTARIIDRAEPAECLSANVVWSAGFEGAQVRLALDAPSGAQTVEGRPAAYLLEGTLELSPGASESWDIVADVGLSQADVVHRRRHPIEAGIRARLAADIAEDGQALLRRLAAADALQSTGNETNDTHHLANVLFNCMRGGVFADGYNAPARDFVSFVAARNAAVAERKRTFLDGLPSQVDCLDLLVRARAEQDHDLVRLCLEYLPLAFSRRHGDPSRPWNAFDIRVHTKDGAPRLYYQGNWRDIFQNWEALAVSFPGFLPHMVAKFVNASTIDGFNPYRITSEGIDWEVPDPEDPWANIGYWGDHQIVYLDRLLELAEAFDPGALGEWLTEACFTYADVPYRLKSYAELIANPKDTITFDEERERAVLARVEARGADGRLAVDDRGEVLHVTLAEKLLVPVLSKLCNLVLDGGVWMNTQRPEWNDANNALAGFGLSMVTVYQLRRHIVFCAELLRARGDAQVALTREVGDWLDAVSRGLQQLEPLLAADTISDADRRGALDLLGVAFDAYRQRVYAEGLHAGEPRRLSDLVALLDQALPFIDRAIRKNRREDGLYHAYNLVELAPDGARAGIRHLYEMLEGQVAVLGSGLLEPEEAQSVISALYASRMYRADQHSFMLYPNRTLPGFLDMNVLDGALVEASPLLRALAADPTQALIQVDDDGHFRFGAHLANAEDVATDLDTLAEDSIYADLVKSHREDALTAWEKVFSHLEFTGRSGTMYGYEGLGCIYWHMVSKLLVSVQESLLGASRGSADAATVSALRQQYESVRGGLGPAKTPEQYGAFVTDPYSHTGRNVGAQQPGMTGQVKEEIVTRFGELGVRIADGRVALSPGLLTEADFATEARTFVDGFGRSHELPAGAVAFTLAGTTVVYHLDGDAPTEVTVVDAAGAPHPQAGGELEARWSRAIFARSGEVTRIEARFPNLGIHPPR